MGIIKKTLSVKPERSAVSIIAEGNHFKGEMNVTGGMHIDGMFEGSIVSNSDVSIGRRGSVLGQIKAPRVNVSGMLDGELRCNEIHIESGGRVNGLVICHKMSIDSDGTFIGERRTIETLVSPDRPPQRQADLVADMFETLPDRIVLTVDDSGGR